MIQIRMTTPSSTVSDGLLTLIAELTAEGLAPEEIRSRTDVDVSFIRRVQALDEFPEALKAISETAWELWQEEASQKFARRRVKLAAREDAPEHYQMLRDLVRTSNELKDSDKAQILRELIKFSGAVDERVEEETISLVPTQLAILQEALFETRDSQGDGHKSFGSIPDTLPSP